MFNLFIMVMLSINITLLKQQEKDLGKRKVTTFIIYVSIILVILNFIIVCNSHLN